MKRIILFSAMVMSGMLTMAQIATVSVYEDCSQNGISTLPGLERVDLGLFSDIEWANMNVGATRPEEIGDYFAWGEINPKNSYTWSNYLWRTNGRWYYEEWETINKYQVDDTHRHHDPYVIWGAGMSFRGDNKTTLEPQDDPVQVIWGGKWRMPTSAEIQELIDECTISWIIQNGVGGFLFTAFNGNSIFFPVGDAPVRNPNAPDESFSYCYWSSSLELCTYRAYTLDISINPNWSLSAFVQPAERYKGLLIRPVYDWRL